MTTSRFLLASQRSGGSLNSIIKRAIVSGNFNFPLINQHQSQTMATSAKRQLITLESMNPNMIKMEYAVRGPLVIRAAEIEKELKSGAKKPFESVIRANIGDCHAMGQPYITFLRDVLALVVDPSNFNESKYPEDAKQRARTILDGCGGGSVGSYSDSAGIECIRRHAAEYIQNRDGGIPARYEDIYLCAGASQSIKAVMNLLNVKIDGLNPGIMVPIPQYPLYSATIAEYGMSQIEYYLDESNKWSLDIPELERSLAEIKGKCKPRAMVVINPGNPTGQVLTKDNIQKIIKFAYDNSLFIFADEVYQDNIYDKDSKFHSFKKVLMEMGEPYNKMEMASFMSCSKGYMGECGIRGGYCELINLDPEVRAMFQKSLSAQLCPTTIGQAAIDCVVNPPKPGEPSYEQFIKEKTTVLQSLKDRAELVSTTLNSFEGFSCNPVMGAMYAFPQFKLPPKAIEAAKKEGKAADVFYAFRLLEATGICIVAGSGFGQRPGTYHFRTTILPQTDLLKEMLQKFQIFHKQFMAEFK
ncbi:alanine aminotransferase 1 [Bradysia coprophila]|uniref:alanine aminotransferase 1 n=1 Tax=Bradysia coprophila TaxID=38358 RepID=UPI00187D954A|nr:alanine aminotransferase 1 [Bradysia coprophila]XP_037050727.1 alanine aminotransferase 1 [Bradysia coprophila]XP_037050732.1 alanine aminotransferase 1 [Bradysia coprophila]